MLGYADALEILNLNMKSDSNSHTQKSSKSSSLGWSVEGFTKKIYRNFLNSQKNPFIKKTLYAH